MAVSASGVTQVNTIMITIMYILTSVATILASSPELSTADDDINPVNRIVNGKPALVRDYPFMVSIQENGIHNCGGTILNKDWILTAAHCIFNKDTSSLIVQAGTRKLDRGGIKKKVDRLIPHPHYQPYFGIIDSDIGVLKLASSLSFDKPTIGIVTTSQQGDPLPDPFTTTTSMGYGHRLLGTPTLGKPLMKIEREIIPNSNCTSPTFNPFSDFCTFDPLRFRCECTGDSGGPLLVNGIQFGVISRAAEGTILCHCPKTKTVYTSISSFRDWITNSIA